MSARRVCSGHAALAVLLRARHLRAAQAAAAADLHALGARADRRGQRPLHRPPERHPVLELLGDRLRDQLGVELRALDLGDVHLHVLRRHRVQLTPQRVHLGAGLADHDAGPGRVDVDGDPLLVLADVDVGEAGVRELAVDVVADLHVLHQRVRELLRRHEPVRLPRVDDADPQAARVDLMSHYFSSSSLLGGGLVRLCSDAASGVSVFFARGLRLGLGLGASAVASASRTRWPRPQARARAGWACGAGRRRTGRLISPGSATASWIVMWQVRLRMRLTRPRARGRQRLRVGPSSA